MKALQVVEKYVGLKQEEKEIVKQCKDLKELFYASCAKVARGKDQLLINGSYIHRQETAEWEYPAKIKVLEAVLKEAKDLFKLKNKPVGTSVLWAVEAQKKED